MTVTNIRQDSFFITNDLHSIIGSGKRSAGSDSAVFKPGTEEHSRTVHGRTNAHHPPVSDGTGEKQKIDRGRIPWESLTHTASNYPITINLAECLSKPTFSLT